MRYRRLNSVLLATVLLLSIGVAYAARVTSSERHAQWPFQSEPRKVYACLRSAAVLTGSYVDTSYIDLRECKQIWLGFNITQGSSGRVTMALRGIRRRVRVTVLA